MLHTTNVTYHNLNELNHDVEIVDFTAVWVQIVVFWWCTNVLEEHAASIFNHKDGSSMFLQNAGIQPEDYMA
jgi:hypothetical protein